MGKKLYTQAIAAFNKVSVHPELVILALTAPMQHFPLFPHPSYGKLPLTDSYQTYAPQLPPQQAKGPAVHMA